MEDFNNFATSHINLIIKLISEAEYKAILGIKSYRDMYNGYINQLTKAQELNDQVESLKSDLEKLDYDNERKRLEDIIDSIQTHINDSKAELKTVKASIDEDTKRRKSTCEYNLEQLQKKLAKVEKEMTKLTDAYNGIKTQIATKSEAYKMYETIVNKVNKEEELVRKLLREVETLKTWKEELESEGDESDTGNPDGREMPQEDFNEALITPNKCDNDYVKEYIPARMCILQ